MAWVSGTLRKERFLPIFYRGNYRGNFKVSLPKELSRKVFAMDRDFAIKTAKPGGTNREVPHFNQLTVHFANDLTRISKEATSLNELQWIAGQMSSNYFWPCTSLGIFYRKYENEAFKIIDAPPENVIQITAKDLAIGVNNSVTENILRTGRATYIPDTKFERITQVTQLPLNMKELLESKQPIASDNVDVREKNWDFSSIRESISPHSGCMFMMPLQLETGKIGLFAVGYEKTYFWGNLLNMIEIQYQYLLGDALKLALGNLLFPAKK